jgi:hypothetical protein
MAIKKEIRDKIVAQALTEIQFSRNYKQGKIRNWNRNEVLYYGAKQPTESSRANVDLSGMSEHVDTLLSKVDNPLTFKFVKQKESQRQRVERLNSLKRIDANKGYWDLKDIAVKKQCIIYGRGIFSYFADSIDGKYRSNLVPVDVYDFLIDPSAGGLDLELAMYMGRYGVTKTKEDLRKGVKEGIYLKYETSQLIEGSSNATSSTPEQVNKQPRRRDQNVWVTQNEITGSDKFLFWEWYTTYDGIRYYLLLNETGSQAIRVEELKSIFASDMFPFWSYAYVPDMTEFWTPSPCDRVREMLLAQGVSINQMLDNAEQVNKPQRVVSVGAIEDFASLKYRKDGIIKVKGDMDVNKAYQIVTTPSISTPLQVYDKLEYIIQKASGVTAGAKGVSEEDKVAVYEGNQANVADRFGLFNKSYSFGYSAFARLYENGVKEHLNKKQAIDIMGPDGIDIEFVNKRDIFRKNDEFTVLVESSNAELMVSELEKKNKIMFLTNEAQNGNINPKKATEMKMQIAGFNEEEIRQLMDTSEFGDAELMSEAERDIEAILDGKDVKPNMSATTAYKQRFVDYMTDHSEDFDEMTLMRFTAYIDSLEPIIMENMVRMANQQIAKEGLSNPDMPNQLSEMPMGSPPTGDMAEQDNPQLEANNNL